MSLYLEIFKKSFLEEYIYKSNTLLKIIRNIIYIFISVNVWSNLLKANSGVTTIKLNDMVSYIIISLLIRNLVDSDVSRMIAEKIKDGSIGSYFVLPVDFNLHQFSYQFGKNVFETIFSTLPVCIAAYFFWGGAFLGRQTNWPIFIMSLCFSIVIMFYIHSILGMFVFWLKSGVFIDFLVGSLFELFGGTFIPLWFYPPFLYNLSKWLPFRLVVFEPILIYLGKTSFADAINITCMQLLWIGALFVIERLLWQQAQKVVTIQGG